MTARGTDSRFLCSVLRNGVGRYVCQLQRLTLTLSRDAQSARGARKSCRRPHKPLRMPAIDVGETSGENASGTWPDSSEDTQQPIEQNVKKINLSDLQFMKIKCREYIEEKVVDFARQNPGIVIYVTPKKSRVPTVVAEYLNGTVKEETLTSKTADEIAQIIQKLANQSGLEIIRIRKPFHTDNPSIQGQWHPFTNKPSLLNVQNVSQRFLPSAEK